MASEGINKFQPDRTMHLRGFDDRGAAAALHSATATSCKVSGVFRDMADFAVLMLWDADNYFEPRRIKYLPDFDMSGMVLSFDLHYDSGLQPIDSPKYNWIDWATLDAIRASGEPAKVTLWDYASLQSGTFGVAAGTFHLDDSAITIYDRVSVWFGNLAYDYIVSYTGEPANNITANLAYQINVTDWSAANSTYALLATGAGTTLSVRAGRWGEVNVAGTAVTWVSGAKFTGIGAGSMLRLGVGGSAGLYTVATVNSPTSLTLTGSAGTYSGTQYVGERGGYDGNMIEMYSLYKAGTVTKFVEPSVRFAGGSSDCTWRVSIDFTALGIDQLRQAWLTFAPRLAEGAAYVDSEWEATLTNVGVSDPYGRRALKVAGAGSVVVGSRDVRVSYSDAAHWVEEGGGNYVTPYFRGFIRGSSVTGDTVTVEYRCQHTHDLYVGTSLYADRCIAGVSLDGDAETTLDCFLHADVAVQTRRKLRTTVGSGAHRVVFRLTGTKHASAGAWDADSSGYAFYFDYLEAAVLSDVPDAETTYEDICPAIDYDTDHAYKLSPQRLMWALDRMGFRGDLNDYVGVFWWNNRVRSGGVWTAKTLTVGGTWVDGDWVIVTLGGTAVGKTVFPADTIDTIALSLACSINELFVGVWAEASGAVVTIHPRTPLWSFSLGISKSSSAGTVTESGTAGTIPAGTYGTWVVDAGASQVINRAATDWHRNLWEEVAGKGRTATAAFSMELLLPPDDPGSGQVWAARFPDGEAVLTDTGFAALKTTHCTFNSTVADYQKKAYLEMAGLMSDAGLTPWLQFGEFLWWFFDNFSVANPYGGMAYYDADTTAAALSALGRPLGGFQTPDDDPSVNSYADANFVRSLIKPHCDAISNHVKASYPSAKFEFLLALDVNFPTQNGYGIGGRLNRYVNVPAEFATKAGSGLDRIKMESLSFGSQERHLDKQRYVMRFPYQVLSWDKADCAYNLPWFNAGCPWEAEYRAWQSEGIPLLMLWAWDHMALMHWEFVRELRPDSRTE